MKMSSPINPVNLANPVSPVNRVYLPDVVGGGYGDFWRCKARYRVLKGSKGSKKSATTALNYITRIMQYPGSNLLVIRKIGDNHRSSTFAQLQWAIHRLGVDDYWKPTTSPMELTYKPTGQKILFRGMDDPLKLASITVPSGYLCWVWIEEAYEIESEDDFDVIDLSVPRGEVPPPLFKQTTLTFNPWNEHHWLKRRFFDTQADNVRTYTTTYLCNEWLDDTDKAVFARMQRDNPRRYRVAGLGDWGVADGLVYDRWEVREFDVDKARRIPLIRSAFGLDYGYTNDPTAFIAAAADMERHILYIYDEHYEKRMLNGDIAAMLVQKGYGKEVIRADSAEPKSNEELRRLGIHRLRAAAKGPDSVINGISRLQGFEMVVHPACIHTAAELAAYVWEKDRMGKNLNRPADSQNHLMDALRYATESLRTNRTPSLRLPGVMGMGMGAGIRGADVSGRWAGD